MLCSLLILNVLVEVRNQLFMANLVATMGVMLQLADSSDQPQGPRFTVPQVVDTIEGLPGRSPEENKTVLTQQVCFHCLEG